MYCVVCACKCACLGAIGACMCACLRVLGLRHAHLARACARSVCCVLPRTVARVIVGAAIFLSCGQRPERS